MYRNHNVFWKSQTLRLRDLLGVHRPNRNFFQLHHLLLLSSEARPTFAIFFRLTVLKGFNLNDFVFLYSFCIIHNLVEDKMLPAYLLS